jgi:hypothetical protein
MTGMARLVDGFVSGKDYTRRYLLHTRTMVSHVGCCRIQIYDLCQNYGTY